MKGIGVDIVEFSRIRAVKNKENFVDKILSPAEKDLYTSFKHEKRQFEFLAGRFAAKEAIYKAATMLCTGYNFNDFAILNDETGAPYLLPPVSANVADYQNINISISHSDNYAVAFVVFS